MSFLAKGPTLRNALLRSLGIRGLASTAPAQSSKSSSTNAYTLLPSNHLPPKPRLHGLTEIRGPYYHPVTQTYLNELLSDWGEYVDGVKFAGGAFSLMPEDRLKGLIETAHKHGEFYFCSYRFMNKTTFYRYIRKHGWVYRKSVVVFQWEQRCYSKVFGYVQEDGVRFLLHYLAFETNNLGIYPALT